MAGILDKIVAYKKTEVETAKASVPRQEMEKRAAHATPSRSFLGAIQNKAAAGRPALIAEIKKASPSKGPIRPSFDPAALARAYERGGAACLSVLTDGPSFQGSPVALIAAREACALPILRKDFMIDAYQVAEARAMGADCILIIMACTSDALAAVLFEGAQLYGMTALFEVHDERELDRALALDPVLIGINNRDLQTFETRLETTERLAPLVPQTCIVVAESGIRTNPDIARLERAGAKAFLVGESLMREEDVEAATKCLLAKPQPMSAAV